MKFMWPNHNLEEITQRLKQACKDKDFANWISFEQEQESMIIKISKFGQSEMEFSFQKMGDEGCLTLVREKLAWAHKPYKEKFFSFFQKQLEAQGGRFL